MKTTVFILSLLCLLVGAANADSVSVNFQQWAGGAVIDPYGVEPASNWYNLQQISDGTDLTTSNGQTSTIDFTTGGGNEFVTYDWSGVLANTPMMAGIVIYGGSTTNLTISDINSTFSRYDVIVYVAGWYGGVEAGAFSDGTATYYCDTPKPPSALLVRSLDTDASDGVDEGTYVRFNGLTADSVTINISVETGSTGIGGFQIVGPDRGAAHLLLPFETANKDFDANELSWVSGDVPDDPNLTVNSFDLYYYSKPTASVTADDPNFVGVTPVTGVTSPYALAFDYDTSYFWYVDSNVTWDWGDSNTLPSRVIAFEVEPSQVPPKVSIAPGGSRTWLGEPVVLSTTVKELDTFTYEWTVVGSAGTGWPAADPPGDPNLFLSDTTLVDTGGGVWTATALFTPTGADPGVLGQYEIRLTATDTVPTTGEDTMWVTVHETACDVWVASGQWRSPFDDNDDCVLDLDDYAAWAAAWLEDRSATAPIIYLP